MPTPTGRETRAERIARIEAERKAGKRDELDCILDPVCARCSKRIRNPFVLNNVTLCRACLKEVVNHLEGDY